MAIPAEIKAVRGRPILPAWRALLRFIEGTGIVRGPGVRLKVGPWGTRVWADSDFEPWAHPFAVSSSAAGLIVSPGTVDGLFPFIEGVSISGEDEDGNPVPAPKLEAKGEEASTTYVVLEAVLGEGGVTVEAPENLRILHEKEPPRPGSNKQPLAAIRWGASGRVRSVFQIVHHNLAFGMNGGDVAAGEAPRAFFWAV